MDKETCWEEAELVDRLPDAEPKRWKRPVVIWRFIGAGPTPERLDVQSIRPV